MLIPTNNKNLSDPVRSVEVVAHFEYWQGLHVAGCRYTSILAAHPNARVRWAYRNWYSIEWMLDGSYFTW